MKTIQQSILHLTEMANWHEQRSPNGPDAVTVPVCASDLRAVIARVAELEAENDILKINVERLMRGPGTTVTIKTKP